MNVDFSTWWVESFLHPPDAPIEHRIFAAARAAWDAASSNERIAILRVQIDAFRTERNEADGKMRRHEELRRQAEKQCDRHQQHVKMVLRENERLCRLIDHLENPPP